MRDRIKVELMRSYYYRGSDSSLGNVQPEWGNLDILGACGASDSGSNPGSGVKIKFHVPSPFGGYFWASIYIFRRATLGYIND